MKIDELLQIASSLVRGRQLYKITRSTSLAGGVQFQYEIKSRSAFANSICTKTHTIIIFRPVV
jgi:hypothetical protein